MTFYSLPDVDVWLALASHEHVHSVNARRWWNSTKNTIAFCHTTQLGLLRLLSTASVMNGMPLSIDDAWQIYERFFEDDRVTYLPEPAEAAAHFRRSTKGNNVSPKIWTDHWLLAVAQASTGELVTFDRALAVKGARCLLGSRSQSLR
jgi:toxin-antitoxin system PIN domain toxin